MDCLFCNIASGKIGAELLHEDPHTVAFKDIQPQAPVHILVIPKKHYRNILETDSQEIKHIFDAIKKIAKEQNLDDGFRVVNNCGELGGQTVNHLHFHILGKRQLKWPPG